LPDGNQNIVFTNFAGQVMLSVFKDVTTSDQWITYHRYDADGRLILTAQRSSAARAPVEEWEWLWVASRRHGSIGTQSSTSKRACGEVFGVGARFS
jgi:hypothetical protein